MALLVAIILALGIWWLARSKAQEPIKGTVVSVDLSGIALDGPAIVTLDTADGRREIHVPSFGLTLCAAKDNIADVYAIQAGDQVAVRGEREADGAIVPCADEEHFLRVVSE